MIFINIYIIYNFFDFYNIYKNYYSIKMLKVELNNKIFDNKCIGRISNIELGSNYDNLLFKTFPVNNNIDYTILMYSGTNITLLSVNNDNIIINNKNIYYGINVIDLFEQPKIISDYTFINIESFINKNNLKFVDQILIDVINS